MGLIEIEDLLRKLKSNLKNSSDVSTKERCYAFEGSEKTVTLTRMCSMKPCGISFVI